MNNAAGDSSSKVPQVTLVFWIIKIAATTLGETGGDALSMTMKLGYAVSTVIFFSRSSLSQRPPRFVPDRFTRRSIGP